MNTLVIEKQTGGYFKFTLNGDTANAITSINNDLLAVGNQLHFKTGNGANIIKEQFIYPADVTIVSGGTFTFTTVAQVWDKLIEIDYFAWLGGGGTGGVDRFDDLLDTFSYTGNAGKAVVVDGAELRLVPITLYNKRLFTELEDTPSSLVPNKMLVVNPAGTAVVLQDQPEQPEQLLNSVGYFDYNDLITQTIPLVAVANVALKLTNDTEGLNTSTDQNPYGVSYVWDYTTNAFNFSELEVGDTIDVRVHVQVTTTSANQKVDIKAKFGIGSVSEFTNTIYENQFKTAGLHEVNFVAPFYMGSTYITDNPAELYLTTDASATVKVDGWYVRILRKNINIITVDYTVPDATTTVKGIVRLAGDLSGTANNPTVPELANKVPTSRTIGTTSPLLGGGALSSNLTLSIQQANSVQSGFVTFADWNRFDEAHNDRIVSAAVTGTTIKTLTLNQHDGGTITANWTDINTDAVTSVFGRTGAVVAANGDYTTTQVTEGTNLYYTEARVDANTNVSANTAARHSAVTIGTANGLSISTQELSLGLASTSATGALSSTDWNTFNGKQAALSGTGFVKVSGTTVSYDNNTYALDSAVVKLTGDQSIAGDKTFTTTNRTTFQNGDAAQITFKNTGDLTKTLNIGYGSNGNIISSTGLDFRVGGLTSSALLIASNENATFKENLTAKSFIKSGGTSSQYLMADGSVSTGSGGTVTSVAAITLGTTGTDLSSTVANGTTTPVITLNVPTASATNRGALSAADWTTFNSKFNLPSLTSGSVLFSNGTTIAQDNANFFWDDTNNRLGIGTTSPSGKLSIVDTYYNTFFKDSSSQYGSGLILSGDAGSDQRSWKLFSKYSSSGIALSFDVSTSGVSYGADPSGLTYSEKMRIFANGNVGINTTTDAGYKLDVNGTGRFSGNLTLSTSDSRFKGGDASGRLIVSNSDTSAYVSINGSSNATPNNIGIITNSEITFNTGGSYSESMRITSGGNVGIGIVPQFSIPTYRSLEIGLTGLIYARSTSDSGTMTVASNLYYNGGWKYKVNGGGSLIGQNEGAITFETAPSGTSGSAATITERMRITSGGQVEINRTADLGNGFLEVNGSGSRSALACNQVSTSSSAQIYFSNPNGIVGSVTTSASLTLYNTTSDYRLKQDFKKFNGLDLVSKIKVYDYEWKSDNSRMNGVIAHELQEVVPYAVSGEKDAEAMQQVDYSKLVPILVQAIQELKQEIEILKNK